MSQAIASDERRRRGPPTTRFPQGWGGCGPSTSRQLLIDALRHRLVAFAAYLDRRRSQRGPCHVLGGALRPGALPDYFTPAVRFTWVVG